IIITNPETGETEEIFVRDGQDGEDGEDGLTPSATVTDNGDGTHTVTIITPVRDPETGEITEITTETIIRDGEDGESPEATVTDNGDGTHTITIVNPDGTTTTTTVRDGQDGEDGEDGECMSCSELIDFLEKCKLLNLNLNITVNNGQIIINTDKVDDNSLSYDEIQSLIKNLSNLGIDMTITMTNTGSIVININQSNTNTPT
ncbi:collagen-flanked surface repeat-containing protein, partial [Aerococcus urinaeequi]|uniref:collagen-flanked surface repeat-containing protein n=1 Tax=Aerococcus urinaeequi TaxID=51665 RepID=UPI003D6B1D0F